MRYAPATLLPLACILGACASTPPVAPGVRDGGPTALTPRDTYTGIVAAIETGTKSEQRFSITDGDDAGRTGVRRIEPHSDGAVVAWIVEGEERPRHENHLTRDDTGGLVVLRMPNRERDVVTRFEPPFVHFPYTLRQNEPVTQELRMLVADFDSPDRINRRGDSVSTITYLGSADVSQNDQRTRAAVIRTELESTFGPANVVRTTDRWFIPGRGLVGERYEETVRVFGIQSERRVQEIWLVGTEPIEDEAPSTE
ncbi:MAG: hypothetical protein Tsb0013_21760 [Phycisphaerales bacterium]